MSAVTPQLLLRPAALLAIDQPLFWHYRSAEGAMHTGSCMIAELSEHLPVEATTVPCCLLLPASEIMFSTVPPLPRKTEPDSAVLSWQLEDLALCPIEHLHAVVAQQSDAGWLIAAVEKAPLLALLAALKAAGFEPDAALPDIQLLPEHPTAASAWQLEKHWLIRLPDGSGFTADELTLPHLMALLPDELMVNSYSAPPGFCPRWLHQPIQATDFFNDFHARARCAKYQLLSREMQPRPLPAGNWRRYVIATMVLLLITLTLPWLNAVWLNLQAARLEQAIAATVIDSSPSAINKAPPFTTAIAILQSMPRERLQTVSWEQQSKTWQLTFAPPARLPAMPPEISVTAWPSLHAAQKVTLHER